MTMKIPETFQRQNRQAGFSLVELIIVVVIMGILAGYVTYNLSSNATELKTFVFNTKTHFHKAKFEAVKRNRNVYIDFDLDNDGTINNGYTIWADDNCNDTYDAGTDSVIAAVVFNNGPVLYDNNPPIGAEPAGPSGYTIGNGVSAANDRFIMRPNGRCIAAGTAYLYLPKSTTDNTISAGPWAIIISPVGRIRVDEWRDAGWVVD